MHQPGEQHRDKAPSRARDQPLPFVRVPPCLKSFGVSGSKEKQWGRGGDTQEDVEWGFGTSVFSTGRF